MNAFHFPPYHSYLRLPLTNMTYSLHSNPEGTGMIFRNFGKTGLRVPV